MSPTTAKNTITWKGQEKPVKNCTTDRLLSVINSQHADAASKAAAAAELSERSARGRGL